MQQVDPEIAQHIILPTGPQAIARGQALFCMRWDYAIAIDAKLKLMEASDCPIDRQRQYRELRDSFSAPLQYISFETNTFRNFADIIRPPSVGSAGMVSRDAVQTLRAALHEDANEFGKLPDHYTDVHLWMDLEARRMATEMEMQRFDGFKALRIVYKSYLDRKARYNHDHAIKYIEGQPCYHETRVFLTMIERIALLEKRVKELESQL